MLRSLDAIHLATAASITAELGVLITYDRCMIADAQIIGLPVSPRPHSPVTSFRIHSASGDGGSPHSPGYHPFCRSCPSGGVGHPHNR
jgi:hypothetical protein